MQRDFDAELSDDRTFKIGGQNFSWRYLHWREFAVWMDTEADKEEQEARRQEAERAERIAAAVAKGDEPPDDLPDMGTLLESYETMIERICLYLSKEDQNRFRALTSSDDVVIPQVSLRELAGWLVEQQTARPTGPAATSSRGRGRTAVSSVAS